MGLCSSNLQSAPATVELQDFDFTLYGMASAPWTTASACQDSLHSGVYILMAGGCRTQNAKVAKALLYHKANGFLRSSRLRPFITCTDIVFQRLFIAQGKTKLLAKGQQ